MQKRVLLINDISGVGKCSLTVSVPIISHFGVTTDVLPTAVLSTHTGGFVDYTFRDLTDDMLKMAEHWKKLGIQFDMIYCGYLGSAEQIGIVMKIVEMFKTEKTTLLIDPVMADFGQLYSHFSSDFPNKLKPLCEMADILTPNITEACLLTNTEYREQHDSEYIKTILDKLNTQLNVPLLFLTGVTNGKQLGTVTYENGKTDYVFSDYIEGRYHGSGDVFSSVLCGALLKDFSPKEAVQLAVDFTVNSIKRTRDAKTDTRFGLIFEPELANLAVEADKK